MEHIFEKHTNCTKAHCQICDGGLAICTICGQAENDLEPACPGQPDNEQE